MRLPLLSVACCGLLVACVTPAPPPEVAGLFQDAHFAPPAKAIDVSDVFAVSDAMRHFLRVEIAGELRREGRTHGLVDALLRRDGLHLEYDAALTRNAAEAFSERKGNCLSLVIMTAALAKELGLGVHYQQVDIDTSWSRTGDLAFRSTHVNVDLGRRILDPWSGYDPSSNLTIDFVPASDIWGVRTRELPERTIVAMYLNNRAAENLARGAVDEAYWWAREAIRQAADYTSAYNTLAVVYLRHGDYAPAERVLRALVARDAGDVTALSNLAIVLEREHRDAESAQLRARLAKLEPLPPFHYFLQGMAALKRGDDELARALFQKEVDRADACGECHFWLALADLRVGRTAEARAQLEAAADNSTSGAEAQLYATKLAHLRSIGMP